MHSRLFECFLQILLFGKDDTLVGVKNIFELTFSSTGSFASVLYVSPTMSVMLIKKPGFVNEII